MNIKNDCLWCDNCEVPLTDNLCGICGKEGRLITKEGLKPVFPKEREIYEGVLEKYLQHPISLPNYLYRVRNRLYFKGELFTVLNVKNGELIVNGKRKLIEERYNNISNIKNEKRFLDHIKRAIIANDTNLQEKEEEAVDFIDKTCDKFKHKEKYVSFSGGKDSTVAAYLVNQVSNDIPLLFADTTIELPETLKFSREVAKRLDMKLIIITPPKNFFGLVEKLGPPSRYMRWCCFTQKHAPFNQFFKDKRGNVLVFDGIRKVESRSRKNFERLGKNTNIIKQISARPILNWTDLEVWLFLLKKSLPLNPQYLYGKTRGGCWPCPNMGKLCTYFMNRVHPELAEFWEEKLFKYAEEYGKDEYWVKGGLWKMRKTKYMDEEVVLRNESFKKKNEYIYRLRGGIEMRRVVEFLKVFGEYDSNTNSEREIQSEKVKIKINLGKNLISVENLGGSWITLNRIEKQIDKALNCIGCGACLASCTEGAISLNPSIHIEEKKCSHCLKCTTSEYLKQACVALHYNSKRRKIYKEKDSIIG